MRTLITFRKGRGKHILACKELGERDDSRVSAKIHQRYFDLQSRLKAAPHGIQQTRISPQIIEMVMQANVIDLQNIPPDCGNGFG